jgi:hypothetical protein
MEFCTLDFEAYAPGTWWTLGILVMEYRTGKVIQTAEFACDRSNQSIPEETCLFWEQHPEAFQYNTKLAAGRTVSQEEERICAFVVELKKSRPEVYFVSDAPCTDVRMLEDILARHGQTAICHRTQTMFRQTICTWSFRFGVASAAKCKPGQLLSLYASYAHVRPVESELVHGMVVVDGCEISIGPRHTSLRDCFHILLNHFKVLDIVHDGSISRIAPLRVRSHKAR